MPTLADSPLILRRDVTSFDEGLHLVPGSPARPLPRPTAMLRSRWFGPHRRAVRRQAGFTLIELLVVLVILGLLAAFVAPQVLNYLGKAKTDAANAQVQNIAGILDLYRLDVGNYPTEDEGLEALLERPAEAERWNGPYVRRRDALTDPWGNLYEYRFPGEHGAFDIYSLGADRSEGGEGENQDVTSW
jgi:general secretion pathway protein G